MLVLRALEGEQPAGGGVERDGDVCLNVADVMARARCSQHGRHDVALVILVARPVLRETRCSPRPSHLCAAMTSVSLALETMSPVTRMKSERTVPLWKISRMASPKLSERWLTTFTMFMRPSRTCAKGGEAATYTTHSRTVVRHVGLYLARKDTAEEDNLVDAGRREEVERVVDERHIAQRHQRARPVQ